MHSDTAAMKILINIMCELKGTRYIDYSQALTTMETSARMLYVILA